MTTRVVTLDSPALRKGSTRPLPMRFFQRDAETVARELLGRYLVRRLNDGTRLIVRLVETEAYLGAPDRASHAWNGRRTPRNEALYRPGGYFYVYFTYGMHYCANVVTGDDTNGEAVLLRAAEPVEGVETMIQNRCFARTPRPGDIAGGPAKLCQALAIDRALDGIRLGCTTGVSILEGAPVSDAKTATGPRVGIGYADEAVHWPLRFAIAGHSEMSRPRLQ